ncbi:drug/metabolite transporter (DMT)-like permease [Clostridium acetobutylicum]|nr:drug/metabolite transporter (DMT)-like permease [Clostridium acetobutylicum]OOL99181.1 4-amino-4-deoxy-L-arabinose-phosphoundecaprenol flippase subunit ArnE [Clostridium acetobutylicum]OOM08161.1 4-amino-4-deoxy-L-arabinose-phosphoundecaprenol flippase subunit ArnE [Clostridium acetobutylicum]
MMNNVMLILVIIIMTLLGSFGGFCFKKSTSGGTIASILTNKFLYIGGFLYVSAAVTNIYALKYMPLSVVMPMSSITYIWSMIISRIVLHEKITKFKITGLALILVGVIFVGLS